MATDPCVRMRWHRDAPPGELADLVGAAPGATSWVGVRGALAAAHLGTLDIPNPAVDSAMRRLLTAFVIRMVGFGIPDTDAWEDAWDELLAIRRFDPGVIDTYLERWRHRLYLRDAERPLLQDPRLAREVSTLAPPGRLVMTRASGSGQPWIDHTPQDEPVDAREALGWIVAWRAYGPSGMGGERNHGGVKHKSMTAGRLRAAISFHPETNSLFHDLLLSAPPPDQVPLTGEDIPEWEAEQLPDPLRPRVPCGPVGRLTGRAFHAVLLEMPDDLRVTGCRIAWAIPVPTTARTAEAKKAAEMTMEAITAATDPFVINRAKGGPLRAAHARALLRDFDTLIAARRTDPPQGVVPPAWLGLLASLPSAARERIGPVRVRVLACDQDKQPRETHWWSAITPVSIAAYLNDPDRAALIAAVRERAEKTETALSRALSSAWRGMSPDPRSTCPWTTSGRAAYWDRADPLFWPALQPGAPAPQFGALARQIFDTETHHAAATPVGMLPVAQARAGLVRATTPSRRNR
ncbi:type I-E CRISPR-associated protein Cse1/CasA [Streptomyces sedi]|uniref:Type I-E CRISPR-associated protein Cse1/CasA n=1 Tax=Streptomyces sedi TaxID=555059 RepID=A0A5C4UUR3_9ACTN|nr:type I-E CRISPR-associated protein Cse1/CasA [Streptomyces sedi]TNM27063.1 type I-E CRISPR-associated protein Cse1/CasA [Streptomyces sedi]